MTISFFYFWQNEKIKFILLLKRKLILKNFKKNRLTLKIFKLCFPTKYLFQDLQTINYEPYQYSGMNITVLRLIDPNNAVVKNIIKNDFNGFTDVKRLTVNQALMYDAIQLFSRAFKEMDDIVKRIPSLPCDGTQVWEHGETLINYIRTVNLPVSELSIPSADFLLSI